MCLQTEQLVYSYCNNGVGEVREGLTWVTEGVPGVVKEWFREPWVDYAIVDRVLGLFNKYFTTKSYIALKKTGSAGN